MTAGGTFRILLADPSTASQNNLKRLLARDTQPHESNASTLSAAQLSAIADSSSTPLEISTAETTEQAYRIAKQTTKNKRFLSVAFVKVDIAGEFDGAEVVRLLWEVDADIQIVAYSDEESDDEHDWPTVLSKLGCHDKLLIVKQPFDTDEISHIAQSLGARRRLLHEHRESNFRQSERLQIVQHALRKRNQHLDLASRIARVGYGSMDLATQEIDLSENARALLEIEADGLLSMQQVVHILPPKDQIKFQLLLDDAIFRESDFEYKFCLKLEAAKTRHLHLQVHCEKDANQAKTGLFFVVRDVSEDVEALQAVQHASMHDPLTGLPNRARFNERLDASLKHAKPDNGTSLILIDLDRFKEVNDSFGHPIGDRLLCEVAKILSDCASESDTVARLGGDEFAIVQPGVTGPNEALELLNRIYSAIQKPLEIEGKALDATVSAGVAISPANGRQVDTLLKHADLALYRAKQDGRGVYRFFDEEMDKRMRARIQLEADLKHALQRHEFDLFFQPVVCTESEKIVAMETLIRWNHPTRGNIRPDHFIELAEENASIVPIGRWVLESACYAAASWPPDVTVAVNVSAIQLRHGKFQETVQNALSASGLEANRLELEITETVFLKDNEETIRTLKAIRECGIRIAMDDFGIGYSSLSYLRSFPFDKIKLDKSFVTSFNEPESKAIITAVSGMGASLSMRTCAEGVETREQFEYLRDEGYTHVQGYLFGRPRPSHRVEKFFRSVDSEFSNEFGSFSP